MLVLTSATHGIEGYCGSGAQVGLLHDEEFLRAVRAARVAVLFVHAVNPHGFSCGRRVNEDNVDLNRNFRDFALPALPNASYADVHEMLLPATWPPPKENEAAIGAYIARHGERAFQAALTGGDQDFNAHRRYNQRHMVGETDSEEKEGSIKIPALFGRISPTKQTTEHAHKGEHTEGIDLHDNRLAPHETVEAHEHAADKS
jgi:hypothetical protein